MNNKLNGSVERLAEALRDVVREGAAEAVEPLRTEIQAVEERLGNRIDQEVRESEERMVERIDGVEKGLNDRIDGVEEHLTNRIDRAVEDIVAERQTEHVT